MLIYNTYLLTLYISIIYVYNTIYSIYNSYFNNLISISIIGYHILYFSAGVHVVWSGCPVFIVDYFRLHLCLYVGLDCNFVYCP